MTNPTSNFGWQMPTSTDLVTDLPADFETFGQAVDTSLADLKGGTTGQVLSKASNTDMDFTWVAQDDSNAIQNAIVDAKGDLIAASAADTPARLAVGNNGETLVADSSTATGLRYQGNFSTGKNVILNSNFSVWQRGTSFTALSTAIYTADRWGAYSGTTGRTVSRQSAGTSIGIGTQYCARIARDSGNTNTSTVFFYQSLESTASIPFAGSTVTLSFYARAGANFSAASSQIVAEVFSGTGTDQNIISGYTGSATVIGSYQTITTSWARYTLTGSVASTATELGLRFSFAPTGTAGANDYFEIANVQLENAAVATSYTPATGTIQGELAACQRYYQKTYNQSTTPGTSTATGAIFGVAVGPAFQAIPGLNPTFVTVMRTAPTMTYYSTDGTINTVRNNTAGTNLSVAAVYDIGESRGGFVDTTAAIADNSQFRCHFTASAEL
jgi:hypothetical protein